MCLCYLGLCWPSGKEEWWLCFSVNSWFDSSSVDHICTEFEFHTLLSKMTTCGCLNLWCFLMLYPGRINHLFSSLKKVLCLTARCEGNYSSCFSMMMSLPFSQIQNTWTRSKTGSWRWVLFGPQVAGKSLGWGKRWGHGEDNGCKIFVFCVAFGVNHDFITSLPTSVLWKTTSCLCALFPDHIYFALILSLHKQE